VPENYFGLLNSPHIYSMNPFHLPSIHPSRAENIGQQPAAARYTKARRMLTIY
jgi:hypothetical protein